ncbi:hypothetical protein NDU88_004260 [Pleurodeles waltl]|uniref:CENP-V/GFA domain-containing protein n=1 Tax=Pleurodeles waltl TaxID=8319 RepID=A0AAV7QC27_PLEWA|nr:hypothetical protein NDU88_004260 [Pleurodeles waltl]
MVRSALSKLSTASHHLSRGYADACTTHGLRDRYCNSCGIFSPGLNEPRYAVLRVSDAGNVWLEPVWVLRVSAQLLRDPSATVITMVTGPSTELSMKLLTQSPSWPCPSVKVHT